jgi:hypothetical protein
LYSQRAVDAYAEDRSEAGVTGLLSILGLGAFLQSTGAPGAPSAAAPALEARAGHLTIAFDPELRRRIEWRSGEVHSVLAFAPDVQDGVRVSGHELAAFRIDRGASHVGRIVDPAFGPGLEAVAVGAAAAPAGIALVRELRVLVPDKLPDVAVFRTTYRNAGRERLHVERVDAPRLLLDRARAEPKEPSFAFATFQGGAYKWGRDYELIMLGPGFRQSNFMGQDDVEGPEGVGGGMPFIDLWGRTMGVAVAHLETRPQWLSLPVEVRSDGRVEAGIRERPEARLGQREWLAPGERYETVTSALIFHRGDSYDALATYGELLRLRGVAIPRVSPPSAHEPYWKSWGFGPDFTVDKILGLLPELRSFGIRTANLDDGWYDFMATGGPTVRPASSPAASRTSPASWPACTRPASAPPSGGTRWASAPRARSPASTPSSWCATSAGARPSIPTACSSSALPSSPRAATSARCSTAWWWTGSSTASTSTSRGCPPSPPASTPPTTTPRRSTASRRYRRSSPTSIAICTPPGPIPSSRPASAPCPTRRTTCPTTTWPTPPIR